MDGRISTGLDPLDRELDGGFLPGSIVVLSTPPESQSDPLLHAAMRGRPATYVTTIRSEPVVEETLDRALGVEGNYEVTHVGVDDPLGRVRDRIELQREGTVVVVDVIGPIERAATDADYVAFLNALKEGLIETDSVAILHAVDADGSPALRRRTTEFADAVMELEVEDDGLQVENLLSIPKFRGDEPPEERIKVELGRDVDIDTSRDIA